MRRRYLSFFDEIEYEDEFLKGKEICSWCGYVIEDTGKMYNKPYYRTKPVALGIHFEPRDGKNEVGIYLFCCLSCFTRYLATRILTYPMDSIFEKVEEDFENANNNDG